MDTSASDSQCAIGAEPDADGDRTGDGTPTLSIDQFMRWVGRQVGGLPVDPEDELASLVGGDELARFVLLQRADGLCGRPHARTAEVFGIRSVRQLYFFYLYADSAPPGAPR